MPLDKLHNNKILIITFTEKHLDSFISDEIKTHVKEIIAKYHKDFRIKQIILSFKMVKVIDSSGIGVILSVWKYCALKKISAQVCITNCSEYIEKVLKLCKLDRIIHIYTSEEEAIKQSGTEEFVY